MLGVALLGLALDRLVLGVSGPSAAHAATEASGSTEPGRNARVQIGNGAGDFAPGASATPGLPITLPAQTLASKLRSFALPRADGAPGPTSDDPAQASSPSGVAGELFGGTPRWLGSAVAPTAPDKPLELSAPTLRVSSVLARPPGDGHGSAAASATINGRVRRVGDVIDGFTLVGVRDRSAIVERDGQRFELGVIERGEGVSRVANVQ